MIKSIDDIFGEVPATDLSKATCHSGGADGSDTIFENESAIYGTKTKAYSYKTDYHKSPNKVEISEEEFQEGIEKVNKANHTLNRYGIKKYMNLIARDWSQIKHSDQVFAIGNIVGAGVKGKRYYNHSKYEVVDGGTGYGVQMGIDSGREVYVFDLKRNDWYHWSPVTMTFVKCKKEPIITKQNFAGIGSRDVTKEGEEAIKSILKRTYNKFNE